MKFIIKTAESENNEGLWAAVDQALGSITVENYHGWFRHMKEFFPQCPESRRVACEAQLDGDPENALIGSDEEDELLMNC